MKSENCKHKKWKSIRSASPNTTEGHGGEMDPAVVECKKCGAHFTLGESIQLDQKREGGFNKKVNLGLLVIAVFGTLFGVYQYMKANSVNNYQNFNSVCAFEIVNIKTSKDPYNASTYYSGEIRNTSDRTQNLKGMIAKLYTKDKLLVSDGYEPVEKAIPAGTALPFRISTNRPGMYSDQDINPDIYPWFTTCN